MELSPTPVPAPDSAVRPVEATVNPALVPVGGHDNGVKAEPTDSKSTTGSKAAVETSAATGGNQEPNTSTEADTGASKSQEASPAPSATPIDAVTSAEHPSDAAPATPAPSESTTAEVVQAEPAISGDSTIDELLAAAESIAPLPTAVATPSDLPTLQPIKADKPTKKEKKPNDSFLPDETLAAIQQFLADKVSRSQCSSHSRDILEFVGQHMNDKQRRRYVGPLVQRIVDQFATESQARGEEVSVDVQTSICLVEQMFLTLGRESPLQDMYTQEEEEMLDLLFHGEGGSESEIASPR